jgi:hypothetical protein
MLETREVKYIIINIIIILIIGRTVAIVKYDK